MKTIGPDDLSGITLELYEFLVDKMLVNLDDDADYTRLKDFVIEKLLIEYIDPNKDFNYN